MWSCIGTCPDFQCGERLWHAGLSADGRLCLMANVDENYIVWDIRNSEVVWREAGQVKLADWADENGYVSIEEGPASGKYRVFGLSVNHAKTKDESTDTVLLVDKKREVVLVLQGSSGQTLQALKYECFSGDWAFASFSDNGEVIAVIEPYYVSFFGKAASG